MDALPDLIGQIYEAALLPSLWAATFDRIARLTEHDGAIVFCTDGKDSTFIASDIFQPIASFVVSCRLVTENSLFKRFIANNYDGFLTIEDLYTLEEWRADPFFNLIARRFDVNFGTGTVIRSPTAHNVIVRFNRRFSGEPTTREIATRLDALRPALARATLLASQEALKEARTAVMALNAIGMPAAALTKTGKVVIANASFEAYTDFFRPAAFGRLSLANPNLDLQFVAALATLSEKDASVGSRSLPVPSNGDRPPLVVHLIPIFRQAHDLFATAQTLLLITPLKRPNLPPHYLLHGLFDLTAAESKLVQQLLAGDDLNSIALANNLQIGTVRKRLKSVLLKTGTHRQADLVALLSGFPALPR